MTDFWFSASHEQFTPRTLIEQAVLAREAGFDGIGCERVLPALRHG